MPSAAITRRLIIELATAPGRLRQRPLLVPRASWLWQQTAHLLVPRLPEFGAVRRRRPVAWRILGRVRRCGLGPAPSRASRPGWPSADGGDAPRARGATWPGCSTSTLPTGPSGWRRGSSNQTISERWQERRRRPRRRARPAMAGRAVAPPRRMRRQSDGRHPTLEPCSRCSTRSGIGLAGTRASLPASRGTCSACRRCPRCTWSCCSASGAHVDLHLYVLNPCREFWFDDRRTSGASPTWHCARRDGDHHEAGNRLLAAWGQPDEVGAEPAGRRRRTTGLVAEDAHFTAVRIGTSVLGALQDAILEHRPSWRQARSPGWPTTAAWRCTCATRSRANSRCCTIGCSR